MHYLTIEITTLESELMCRSTAEQKGIWLDIYAYCARHENSATIKDCRNWTDSTWMRLIGHPQSVLLKESPLWWWRDQNLILNLYNDKSEYNVKKMRQSGKEGAKSRWKRQSKNRGAIRGANGEANGNQIISDKIATYNPRQNQA